MKKNVTRVFALIGICIIVSVMTVFFFYSPYTDYSELEIISYDALDLLRVFWIAFIVINGLLAVLCIKLLKAKIFVTVFLILLFVSIARTAYLFAIG